MPVRQLSNAINPANASNSSIVTISTLRVPASGGESAAGASGSSTTISFLTSDIREDSRRARGSAVDGAARNSARSVRDESRFRHQVFVERFIRFEKLEHVRTGEENRFQRLLFHVV